MVRRLEAGALHASVRVDPHKDDGVHLEDAKQIVQIGSVEYGKGLFVVDDVVARIEQVGDDLGLNRAMKVVAPAIGLPARNEGFPDLHDSLVEGPEARVFDGAARDDDMDDGHARLARGAQHLRRIPDNVGAVLLWGGMVATSGSRWPRCMSTVTKAVFAGSMMNFSFRALKNAERSRISCWVIRKSPFDRFLGYSSTKTVPALSWWEQPP